ncbi:Uncharacterized protein PBTT_09303 [Plasmodiophora brassicae]|uniref:Uncharacterized protein n=1 Tax=Plasmodiophora brassicae TaxID=37360 RepID=A0A0G4IPQ0_PLABS|nr:hypothetical protein PBRA_005750 [Plasmodiophora brassicae]SPR01120.1 unnamed protein product [Plasmodiophora brassicae]
MGRNDAAVTDAAEESYVDLAVLMAPLSRDRLEVVLAQCIAQHEDCLDVLRSELRRPIEDDDVEVDVSNTDALRDLLDRANAYLAAGASDQCSGILERITTALWSVSGEGDQEDLEAIWQTVEQTWQSVIDRYDPKNDYKAMKGLFEKMARWRQRVQPLLTEPLRDLKVRIDAGRSERPNKRARSAATGNTPAA